MKKRKIYIYETFRIEDIKNNDSLRQTILNWYESNGEWRMTEEPYVSYELSSPIGAGRTAVAYRITAPTKYYRYDKNVVKLFYPTKNCRTIKLLNDDYKLGASEYKDEFVSMLNGFIDSVETAWRVKKAYEESDANVVLNMELAMTSMGISLLSDNLGETLEEETAKLDLSKKENLICTLKIFNKILNNDITVYHEECKQVHLDIKSDNFLMSKIDMDGYKTPRSLDLGSVRTIKELIAKKDITLFESSPQINSFELIEETVQQIKICNENEATLLLKQLDLLAVVKMMLIAVFSEDIFDKELEQRTANKIARKISKCLHGDTVKASFSTLHIIWLFQKLLLTINRIENCEACEQARYIPLDDNECNALTDKAIEGNDNSLLNSNNILTLSKLMDYISDIIEILENEEGCYKLNHANYKSFDHLLENNNITTMSALLDLAESQFGTYAVPPIKLIEYFAYPQN